jgi:hypothetical protein
MSNLQAVAFAAEFDALLKRCGVFMTTHAEMPGHPPIPQFRTVPSISEDQAVAFAAEFDALLKRSGLGLFIVNNVIELIRVVGPNGPRSKSCCAVKHDSADRWFLRETENKAKR